MKIAISAAGRTLDSEVNPRFGRCQYFIVVDSETMQYEIIENDGNMAAGGAGISAAHMVASKEVQAVLTGHCGPNAYQVLSTADIQVITGVSGKVKDAIQNFKSGQYQTSSGPTESAHFGITQEADTDCSRKIKENPGPSGDSTGQSPDATMELQNLRQDLKAVEGRLSEIQSLIDGIDKNRRRNKHA